MKPFNELPVSILKGVGPRNEEFLAQLRISTVQDLLFHLPIRYEDRTQRTPINTLKTDQQALVQGQIRHIKISGRKRENLVCYLEDETGILRLRFFHVNDYQRRRLQNEHVYFRCFGTIHLGYDGELEMFHPEIQMLASDKLPDLTPFLTPIYATTKGLHQLTLRKLMEQALNLLRENLSSLPELLPIRLLQQLNMPDLYQALFTVHQLQPNTNNSARQRLAIEELIAHHVSFQTSRMLVHQQRAAVLNGMGELRLRQRLLNSLPFQLTLAQERVVAEILQDMQRPVPMLRLVQGDVGSGKTIVAAMAILQAIEQGYQAAIMAPTELLAEQHYYNFKQWFEPLGITVSLLTGSQKNAVRRETLSKMASGEIQLMIGTHALFQEGVNFHQLALMVIDEQHRFGVHQRLALREKGQTEGYYPHQLIMTATPIPRTLAMTIYADLDCSVIDELPPGRKPITTLLVENTQRQKVLERVYENCRKNHRQVYWVCTLIEESEQLQSQAAEATAIELQARFPDLRIGLIHGRLKADEKAVVMEEFRNQSLNILVATTVIEVGVDVPTASLMIIENPERLGLAQLHQLRGRIGRGSEESHCVLLYQAPLSVNAKERLLTLRETQDGFAIAEKDLEMRGPGEVLGSRQAGLLRLRIADLVLDKDLLPKVQSAGQYIVQEHYETITPLIKRWIVSAEEYVRV